MQQPARLRADLEVHIVPDATILLWDGGERVLEEPAFARIVPLLDGSRTAGELIKELGGEVATPDVLRSLVTLQEEGLLSTLPLDADHRAAAAFWEANGVAAASSATSTVSLVDLSGCGAAEAVDRALRDGGHAVLPDGDLRVVITRHHLQEPLEELNRQADRPWLLARAVGRELWLGPLFVPGTTACWACLSHRLERNQVGLSLATAAGRPVRLGPDVDPTVSLVFAGLVTAMVHRWSVEPDGHPLLDHILTFDVSGVNAGSHRVTRRPQCPVCGDPTPRSQEPIELQRGRRRATGGHVDDGASFVETWSHHISPITGIVPDIEPVQNDGPAHLYRARIIPRPVRQLAALHAFRRNNAAGKGTTAAHSKASALGEAFERYAMWWDGGAATVVDSYEHLDPATTVHPNAMMLYSEAQLEAGPTPDDAPLRDKVPTRFDVTRPAEWVQAWSLTHQAWRLVPAGLVYMGRDDNHARAHLVGDSNGNACGGTVEDAIASGLYELVERDAVAQWWYNRLPCPGVSLEGVDDPYMAALREEQERLGREHWVLELSADLPVPVFVSMTRRTSDGAGLVYGLGAHVDPRIGIIRAVTEMSQCMPSALRQYQRLDRMVDPRPPEQSTSIRPTGDYLLPDPDVAPRTLADYTTAGEREVVDDVQELVDALRTRGLDTMVVDMTNPDVGVPVVKVIVPGMRLHWRRLAPGRLYDIPVAQGRLPVPTPEDEVNPADLEI